MAGCATTKSTVYPYADHYQVVTTARGESESSQGAVAKAQEVCKGKQLTIQKNETVYQGIDQSVHQALNIVHQAAFLANGTRTPSGDSDTDYKTTITFTCQ